MIEEEKLLPVLWVPLLIASQRERERERERERGESKKQTHLEMAATCLLLQLLVLFVTQRGGER